MSESFIESSFRSPDLKRKTRLFAASTAVFIGVDVRVSENRVKSRDVRLNQSFHRTYSQRLRARGWPHHFPASPDLSELPANAPPAKTNSKTGIA